MDPSRLAQQRGSRRKSSLAFPSTPLTKRGGFIGFLEDSGTADIFLELFSRLFTEKEKPEDPIHLIHKYLREKAPSRQMEIDSLLETLQQDILQTAHEIEEFKDRLQMTTNERKTSLLGRPHLDPGISAEISRIENDPDQRWYIKPDPLFRPTLNVAGILNRRQIEILEETKSVKNVPGKSDIRLTTFLPSTLLNKEGSDAYETLDSEDEVTYGKSTETSPQPSSYSINDLPVEERSGGSLQKLSDLSRTQYKIYDPKFFTDHIPLGFWKEDFSLDELLPPESEESEVEEDKRLIAKNYKFQVLDDSSWLPERDVVHLNSGQQEGELIMRNVEENASGTPLVASVPPPRVSTTNVSRQKFSVGPLLPPLHNSLSHYEWIRKTYGPILLKESGQKSSR